MNARLVGALEAGICLAASATFAGAVGFAAFVLLRASAAQPQLGIIAAVAAVIAFLASNLLIRGNGASTSPFRPVPFEVAEFEPFEAHELSRNEETAAPAGELVLTEAERIGAQPRTAPEPLVLDDVLAKLEPDSRVVRLFDRKAMPTPGQLQSRIDDHLGQRTSAAADASQALSDALAELRRSLR